MFQSAINEGLLYEANYHEHLEGIKDGGANSLLLTGAEQTWFVVMGDCLLLEDNGILRPALIR